MAAWPRDSWPVLAIMSILTLLDTQIHLARHGQSAPGQASQIGQTRQHVRSDSQIRHVRPRQTSQPDQTSQTKTRPGLGREKAEPDQRQKTDQDMHPYIHPCTYPCTHMYTMYTTMHPGTPCRPHGAGCAASAAVSTSPRRPWGSLWKF